MTFWEIFALAGVVCMAVGFGGYFVGWHTRGWEWWQLRKMRRDPRPYHEQFPDIKYWRVGDTFTRWRTREGYSFLREKAKYEFIGIADNGLVHIREGKSRFTYWPFNMIHEFHNQSAQNRRLKQNLDESSEYQTLLDEFQRASEELRKRDSDSNIIQFDRVA